ncbi:N-acetylmuramoyl-L-alanine amidase [Pullulanibacillus pueri]|uniref:Putative N-acetylmuramoyl-L-alanine amidase YrvJ n=1 Tax=Pullulanibacillus pueri TaxID=1437324 RepID=A0A8J2ZZD6_9BACL|nr:N-acetylmuramoyl-L-alanine amidase [Pullulanibacillus pueri]MBM7683771.1 N-acetylmuramoyl-L-alanine amidase [Pullulanibacillus pueri]GGH87290.1 putative N-acetylmuramoyl-L-alanine amidase YrvJ [Pullulanibacillus pueri]
MQNLILKNYSTSQLQWLIRFSVLAIILLILFLGFGHKTHANENTSVTVSVPTLNVRASAEISASVIDKIHEGETYTVIKTSGDWDQIQVTNQETGWVANWLVKETKASTDTNEKVTVTSKVKGLNVHTANDFNSNVIGQINPSKSYPQLQDGGKLVQIQTQQAKGWVAAHLVNRQTVQDTKPTKATVQAPILNVREQPGISYGVIAQLKSGETITLTAESNGWGQINIEGKEGWISEQYLSKQPSQPTVTKAAQTSKASKVAVQKNEKPKTKSNDHKTPDHQQTNTLSGKTIVLDPGHGGKDNGTTSINGVHEKQLTLETANKVAAKLKAAGAHVILTRTNDTYIPLQKRTEISHEDHADAFISLHYNYSQYPYVKGLQNFYYNQSRDGALASALHDALIKETGLSDRGDGYNNLYVLRNNSQPSTLIELGFLSNKTEETVVENDTFREKVAQGIYQGLLNYFSR